MAPPQMGSKRRSLIKTTRASRFMLWCSKDILDFRPIYQSFTAFSKKAIQSVAVFFLLHQSFTLKQLDPTFVRQATISPRIRVSCEDLVFFFQDFLSNQTDIRERKQHTLSWLVTVSCWFVGARIMDPVADLSPSLANELWVVSHVYWLNGNPFS
jgi:hypothetical protein